MKHLVLNRAALLRRPYQDWLGPEHRAVLVTDARSVSVEPDRRERQLAGYDEVRLVDAFHDNAALELDVLELHATHGFDRIVALGEFDLLRAARLRELLGLPGQSVKSAQAYRDKLTMKRALLAAGLPLAPFAPVPDATSLVDFVRRHGYPVVMKPRRGGGSMGVTVLRDEAELRAYAAANPALGTDDAAQLLAETYLDHELFHIDGIVVDSVPRLVWASTQGRATCLGALSGEPVRSCMLDADDPLLAPLRELTTRALAALPTPDTTLFHAEVFRTPDGELVFNEIGCRMGGGRIEESLELGFGVSLPELYVKALAGRPLPEIPTEPARIAGLLRFPPRHGTVRALPGPCEIPGVVDFQVRARLGAVLGRAKVSAENFASGLAVGERAADVLGTLDRLESWARAKTVIDPVD
ncbi:acetyl-CoA carboxylase biotin carboxylase subunit family protein [Streptomyces sp. KL110A]|uniref:ATP-grasp domain-containing protein n=1 Tax=Streptomyces sp. KL110A TaxID=3384221 RepID=UPI0038C8D115